MRRALRIVPAVAAILVVVYAALLRFGAVVEKYGPVANVPFGPSAQRDVAAEARRLHLSGLEWEFVGAYHGDPSSYLKIARERTTFYQAAVREPLFVWSIKLFLWITGGQDVAVSLASALYSTLLVLAVYWTGSFAFSRPVGLGAALALAVDAQSIGLGADGWRDDAFAFFTLCSTYGFLRLQRKPSLVNALLAGTLAGATVLVRVTALSFVLPTLAYVALIGPVRDLRRRLRVSALALGVAAILVVPFFANCAAAYGDPLISINFATGFYRERAHQPTDQPMSAAAYLGSKFARRPLATFDLMIRGLVFYPFENKWVGLRYLSSDLMEVLRCAAIAGLVVFLFSGEGRVLLVALAGALLPFAFTWQIPGGASPRFTLVAYPFYLIAAFAALALPVKLVGRGTRARIGRGMRVHPGRWTVAALLALITAGIASALPRWWGYLILREEALATGGYSIVAGREDGESFGEGWYEPVRTGNVTGRYSHGRVGTMFVPIFVVRAVHLRFRLQACSPELEPEREVRLSVNGTEVAAWRVVWNPLRAGVYDAVVPKALLHRGWNRIELSADGSSVIPASEKRFLSLEPGQDTAFFLWYVRVSPDGGGGESAER